VALLRRAAAFLASTAAYLVAASLLAAMLFRVAPGSDADARELNPALSQGAIDALRQTRQASHARLGASWEYFAGVVRGDLGRSEVNDIPVSQMIAARVPATGWLVFESAVAASVLAVGAALAVYGAGGNLARTAAYGASSLLLAVPATVAILLAILTRIPPEIAAVAAVAPRVFAYLASAVEARLNTPYVLNARASGSGRMRILAYHVLPAMKPELAGILLLASVSALAVAVPVEILTARPGIGELAWRATLDRDMPVVLGTTLLLALAMRLASACSGLLPGGSGAPL
jgi:peptide/nickel transport system permease protein